MIFVIEILTVKCASAGSLVQAMALNPIHRGHCLVSYPKGPSWFLFVPNISLTNLMDACSLPVQAIFQDAFALRRIRLK